ncbi:uncharacterized protein DSM5745_01820 [Aspergillus mulundensis]|uniref:non-specific serine/threonine protein kinase n=1 Tax=Aspergillus mulundensis TaxID=1810919 RepID=A0A3D8SUS7_9EURO|nr:Uncharacterized protein DSM5745_01820 [Aspergillus mulundensis]RDW90045.1 Uncharacterized protein DSM5745_01820 [Aspergillus mulundensis]
MRPSILRFLSRLSPWPKWKPLDFSNPNFGIIAPGQRVEEETIPGYLASRYYPTRIGEVIRDRYQVVGELGYGVTSTVWLARDMEQRSYVALKIYVDAASMGQNVDHELKMYERISRGSKHPGRRAIRPLLDSFNIVGNEDKHQCLLHPPLFENIKADNIMFGFADDGPFKQFEQEELQNPSPRKEEDGQTIYLSRELAMQPGKLGAPVLCDFGSAATGDVEHYEDIQPEQYRAPEVIIEAPWSYSVDIWNVGCMIWNIFEGGSLFTGIDPGSQTYKSKAHLAEIINLLGPPPPSVLARGKRSGRFFSEAGEFLETSLLREYTPLEKRETTLDEDKEDKKLFLQLMRKMLQWEPEERASAGELVRDEWIRKHTGL